MTAMTRPADRSRPLPLTTAASLLLLLVACRQPAAPAQPAPSAAQPAAAPEHEAYAPGLGEIMKKPARLREGFIWDSIPPHYEMAKAAFGVERMTWGSNFPPCAAKEGYRNTLNWVRELPVFQALLPARHRA